MNSTQRNGISQQEEYDHSFKVDLHSSFFVEHFSISLSFSLLKSLR